MAEEEGAGMTVSYQHNYQYQYELKVMMIGELGVGKTSLVKHFTDGHFWSNAGSTIGVEYCNAKIVQVDGHNLKLDLWDTAGEERFSSIIRPYYRNVVGVLLIFSITDRNSFAKIPEWIDDVEQSAKPYKPVFILVGNKCDEETKRQVSKKEAQNFATQHSMDYIETSAETRDTIYTWM